MAALATNRGFTIRIVMVVLLTAPWISSSAVARNETSKVVRTLAKRCEQMLSKQREYDNSRHAQTTAAVLDKMTEEITGAPICDILPLLEHPEWEIRYSAATSLIGNEKARVDDVRQALAQAMVADTNQYSLPQMIQAVSYTGAKEATPTLSDLIVSNQPPHVRYAAVEAQYWLQDPRSVPALLRATEDSDSEIALRAVYVLGNMNDQMALPRIRDLAFHGRDDMQIQAIQGLGMMRDRESGPTLLTLLKTNDMRVLEYTIWALGEIRWDEAVRSIIPLLAHENKNIRDASCHALLTIRNMDVLQYFMERYSANPTDCVTLDAIRVAYGNVKDALPNQKDNFTQEQLSRLANYLTVTLSAKTSKTYPKEVMPSDIRTVREVNRVYFVLAQFEHSSLEFIVLKDKEDGFCKLEIIFYSIQ